MSNKEKSLSPAQLSILFANLAMVMRSGIPLSEGLDILRSNTDGAAEQALLSAFLQANNSGAALTTALQGSRVLPNYAAAMLAIAEKTGNLEQTFAALADYYGRRDDLLQAVRSSVVYPLTMLVMIMVVLVVLLVQVMPVFDNVFRQLGFEMTGISAGLLQAGQFLGQFGAWIDGVAFVLVLVGVLLAFLPPGRRFYNRLFQAAPFTRDLSLRLSTQRFALAMSTMLRSGLQLDVALQNAAEVVEDRRAKAAVARMRQEINQGAGFFAVLKDSGLFSRQDLSLLAVGSKTGVEVDALDLVGTRIANATESRLQRLVAVIEPSMVAIMCVAVGLILLSVMLPLLGALTGF